MNKRNCQAIVMYNFKLKHKDPFWRKHNRSLTWKTRRCKVHVAKGKKYCFAHRTDGYELDASDAPCSYG